MIGHNVSMGNGWVMASICYRGQMEESSAIMLLQYRGEGMRQWLLINLLLLFVLLINTQFLTRNQWRVISRSPHRRKTQRLGIFDLQHSAGIASFRRKGSSISIIFEQTHFQYFQLQGQINTTTIIVDFHSLQPSHFGKIEGTYLIKIKSNHENRYKSRKAAITYWPNHKIIIALANSKITISARESQLTYVVIISICLAGIKILLLVVLLRRKRWTEMSEKFLIGFVGWHFKYLCILWHQNSLAEDGPSLCFFLLLVLTLKSVKVLAECFRISNKIIRNVRMTGFLMLGTMITMLSIPLRLLHICLPFLFGLQFKKYTGYSKLDSQVHYCFINLNLILSFQLSHRLYSFDPNSLPEFFLLILTLCSFAAFLVLGEYYQYSQSSNKSSLCITTNFPNKVLCPYCKEDFYQYSEGIVPELSPSFAFEKWRFSVADCGHIFHQKCFHQMKIIKLDCPLIPPTARQIQAPKTKSKIQ